MNQSTSRKNLTTRVRADLQKAIKHQAVDEERDLSDLIEDAIALYLKSKQATA